ncbi:Hypothetical predicted protein [Lecanosticta acicola]|uniref:Uncharacterized protein n=1 Tax=Lecanosticta acicola TaxID=111012 RepID=A0AAI9EFC3_9PEZI|nr:Hypothetical predicted protein [Lecanosticta acicola]
MAGVPFRAITEAEYDFKKVLDHVGGLDAAGKISALENWLEHHVRHAAEESRAIFAYWGLLKTCSAAEAARWRNQFAYRNTLDDIDRIQRQNADNEAQAKGSVESRWQGWDWKVPARGATPAYYNLNILKKLVTLSIAEPNLAPAMAELGRQIELRRKDKHRKCYKGFILQPVDVDRAVDAVRRRRQQQQQHQQQQQQQQQQMSAREPRTPEQGRADQNVPRLDAPSSSSMFDDDVPPSSPPRLSPPGLDVQPAADEEADPFGIGADMLDDDFVQAGGDTPSTVAIVPRRRRRNVPAGNRRRRRNAGDLPPPLPRRRSAPPPSSPPLVQGTSAFAQIMTLAREQLARTREEAHRSAGRLEAVTEAEETVRRLEEILPQSWRRSPAVSRYRDYFL